MEQKPLIEHDESARARLSSLSAAMLRIGASLDVQTVLREVVEGARALTGARYGVITTVDDSGQPRDFVTSGLTEEERGALLQWPDGPALFEHLRDIGAPLRGADLPGYIGSLDFPAFPIGSSGAFQVTPMRYGGAPVGGFFLVAKSEAFTLRDEEVLVLFAAQAAAAIDNARAHREEQRARANLEALVEASPVGVVVFDAATATPISVNRTARRIVAGLHEPGRDEAQQLGPVRCHLADGREVALEELPRAQTLHAEEVRLSAPDGKSLRTLINVSPVHSPGGAVATVVVTMQDLAPLEALERSRTEFLGMVSHELRAPLAAVKGSAATALGATRALDPAEVRQFFRIVEEQADRMDGLIVDLLDAGRLATGTLTVQPAPERVLGLVERARRTFLGGGAAHEVLIDLEPGLPPVMADASRISQVLDNLLSNAARYAPPSSPIRVTAAQEDGFVSVSVSDEGPGLDPRRLGRLFETYDGQGEPPDGAGLGLAICRGLVEAHGGRIRAERGASGRGTRIAFTLQAAEAAAEAAGGAASAGGAKRTTVLVVDDDPQSLREARDALVAAGYAAAVTGEPDELPVLLKAKRPGLVLMDLVLPGTDGLTLMQEVAELADVPVIFVSAYGRGDTVAQALEAGAADYIVKPFSAAELTARVRAALRRRQGSEPFVLGELTVDYERRRASVAGRDVALTRTEYEVLRALSVNAGRVLTYASLIRQAWGESETSGTGPVRGLVRRLRRKLGDDASRPLYVLNERGVGYRMPRPGER